MSPFGRSFAAATTLILLCVFPESAAALMAPADTTRAAVQLEVSLAERTLVVRQGEQLLASFPVTIGKAEYPTPAGSFHIERIIWNPGWVPPNSPWARGKRPRGPGDPANPMGRVKIFFAEPDYYLHGTNEEEALGSAASHGCVRLRTEDIVALARLLMEHGGEGRPSTWFDGVLVRRTTMQEVRLPLPVPIRVHEGAPAPAGR